MRSLDSLFKEVTVFKVSQGLGVGGLFDLGDAKKNAKVLKTLRGQSRNGLSKNTLLDYRFSARRLRRSSGAPPPYQSRFLVEGDATKHFSVKKRDFQCEKGGGNSVNQGFGKDLHRKGNSVKRFGPFAELPDSEN